MAQIFSASTYPFNGFASQGLTKGFPSANTFIEDISTQPLTLSNVVCISKITILPTGLTLPGRQNLYSPTAAATLITAANA